MSDSDHDSKKNSPSLPWYEEGLRFKCTECGKCCTGSPGFVWVSDQEIKEMAEFLDIPTEIFKKKYLRKRNHQYALVEKKSENHACIFLRSNKCLVYKARPNQCRTFPWWKENLISRESWESAAQECEGINNEAPLVTCKEIIQIGQF